MEETTLIPNFQPPLNEQPKLRTCPNCQQALQPSMVGTCPFCGAALPDDTPQTGPWRTRKGFVTRKDVPLPARCVKCNDPSDRRKVAKLQWAPPWVGLMILLTIIALAIVYLIMREEASIEYSLCTRCRQRTAMTTGVVLALAAGGVTALIYGFAQESWVAFLMIPTLLAAAIIGVIWGPNIRAFRIDREYAWVKGAGRAFRDSLPSAPTLLDR